MKTRLKEFKEKNGLTQAQVAKTLYLSKSAISHYESGIRNIPNELLVKFYTGIHSILQGESQQ